MTAPRRLFVALFAGLSATALFASSAPAAMPTDPQAASQEPLQIMRVPQALDAAARPLADVPVLVADTGLDLDHPDIAPRLFSLPSAVPAPDPDGAGNAGTVPAGSAGWDLLGAAAPGAALQPDGDPSDPAGGSGHGTAVSGVLGAAHNNGQGGAGIAPNARFVALRTCWDGDQCYQYIQAAAINWAADRGVRVVSFSWLSGPLEAGLRDAITSHPNVLFVGIPSGNGGAYDADGEDPQPCRVDAPNVLCVSTSAPNDGLDCGAYGPTSVDVAVPTQNSVTTVNGGSFGPTGCATSYASPTAAGVATILFGIEPAATPAEVRSAIVDSARKSPAWAGRSLSGGVIDAEAAVNLFQSRRGLVKPPAPAGGTTPAGATTPAATTPTTRPTAADRTAPTLRVRRDGRRLVITLSEPATVRVAIDRRRAGRKRGSRCVVSASRGKRCFRWTAATTLKKTAPAGTLRLTLPARAKGRRLPAGTYRAIVRATDAAGNASKATTATYSLSR